MNRAIARTLQVAVVGMGLGLLLAQALIIPVVSGWMAEAYPEFAWARWSLAIPLIAVLACLQVVPVATWALLGRVARDRIFDRGALRWVDAIIGGIGAGWLIALITCVWQTLVNVSAPWILLSELLGLLVGMVVILLIVVLRGLLVQATNLQTEMDAVI